MTLLTMKELARHLKISLSLAYRLVAQGEIPCYKIATCKRVSEADVSAYLERQRKEFSKPPPAQRRHF